MKLLTKSLSIVAPTSILIMFSLAILGSISPEIMQQQAVFVGIGSILFILFSLLDYHAYSFFSWSWYVFANFLLLLTLLIGTVTRGSARWISLGFFSLQPSEFVKPLLIIFMAVTISKSKDYIKIILSSLLPLYLVFKQPDLGSTIIIALIIISQLIASKMPKKIMIIVLGVVILASPMMWQFIRPYQKQRIYSFIDPSTDPLGAGYNSIQSVIAVGSGKIIGKGLGQGTQSQLRFLPERHTDFIFAAIAEEFGFLGSAALVLSYGWLLWAILQIASNAKDESSRLMCIGVFSTILIQSFVNIGMNLGVLPITGITLPLVSAGGSSFLATAMMLGIVNNAGQTYRINKPSIQIR